MDLSCVFVTFSEPWDPEYIDCARKDREQRAGMSQVVAERGSVPVEQYEIMSACSQPALTEERNIYMIPAQNNLARLQSEMDALATEKAQLISQLEQGNGSYFARD